MSDSEDDLPPETEAGFDGDGDRYDGGDGDGAALDALPDDIAPVSLVSVMRKSYLE